MAMEAQQPLVFAGGYAEPDEPGLRAYAFDGATGTLTDRGAVTGLANPSFFVAHPTRQWLFAVNETNDPTDGGGVSALRLVRSADDGPVGFELLNTQRSAGDHPCHLILDQTGRWLVVSNYSSGSVGVLPVGDDGALGPMRAHIQHRGSGPQADRQAGPHAHSAAISADNRFVIVADLGIDALMVYAFDAGDRHLYVANELDNTVVVNAFDAATGAIRELQVLSTLPDNPPHSQVADIHLAPDGNRLLVSNRGHNSLAVYDVAPDGSLRLATIAPCGGDWPRNFAVAPDGRFVLVANQNSGDVSVLPLGSGAAAVGAAVASVAVPQVACVQFVQLG